MTQPLDAIQRLSRTKALMFAGLILVICFLISFAMNIPAMGLSRVEKILENAGFSRVTIGEASYDMGGIRARDITLDSYGFDKVAELDIRLSWPSFLLAHHVKEIKISGLTLTRRAGELKRTVQKPLENLLQISDTRVVVENATLDLGTSLGALRFTLQATIDPPGDDGIQKISANLAANQYQLGFDTKWSGTLNRDGQLDLNADLVDGRLHLGPMTITRYNGWIAIKAGKQEFALQSQIDAGGAHIFGVPLQDVTLVSDASLMSTTMLFRAGMAGLPQVALTADLSLATQTQEFDLTLKGDNLSQFLKRVAAEHKDGASVPKSLDTNTPFRFSAAYQPDRRFAGGPLPFALEGTNGDSKILFGNFLIYPDAMDMRGSAEIDPAMAQGLQKFLSISSDKMDRNFIRLDSKFDALFKQPVATTQP